MTRDVHWCVTVDYQQIANDNIANQIHGFTTDCGKFILLIIIPRFKVYSFESIRSSCPFQATRTVRYRSCEQDVGWWQWVTHPDRELFRCTWNTLIPKLGQRCCHVLQSEGRRFDHLRELPINIFTVRFVRWSSDFVVVKNINRKLHVSSFNLYHDKASTSLKSPTFSWVVSWLKRKKTEKYQRF